MKTIMIMDVTAKRTDLEKKAIEEKILKEIKKKKKEKPSQPLQELLLVKQYLQHQMLKSKEKVAKVKELYQ